MADREDPKGHPPSVHERIEKLAYLLWEMAGRHHGMSLDYWLAAEREIMTRDAKAARQRPAAETPAEDDTAPPDPPRGD